MPILGGALGIIEPPEGFEHVDAERMLREFYAFSDELAAGGVDLLKLLPIDGAGFGGVQ